MHRLRLSGAKPQIGSLPFFTSGISLIPRLIPVAANRVSAPMKQHFADRLTALCRARGNALCVGLDPRWQQLPLEVRRRHGQATLEAMASAFEEFCLRVLDVVAPLVAVVKPQSAFFEACGPAGMRALQTVLARAQN